MQGAKKILTLLLPPIAVKAHAKLRRIQAGPGRLRSLAVQNAFYPDDSKELCQLTKTSSSEAHYLAAIHSAECQTIYAHRHDLAYSGGISYCSPDHPFAVYYRLGYNELQRYYMRHQPKTIFQKHFLSIRAKDNREHHSRADRLPWLFTESPHQFEGEEGLDASHGIQHYGPVSQKKLRLEADRLSKVKQSIELHGYVKELAGLPRGYFLINDITNPWQYRFHVIGGQHRVAAMIHLKYQHIPCSFQPCHPRAIYRSHADKWPSVANNTLSLKDGLAIFDSYFRDPAKPLPLLAAEP